jgi:hypothetical protein
MIKNKKLLVVALACFVGVNTYYFWETFLGPLFFPLLFVFLITLLVSFILLFREIFIVIREKFGDRQRIYRLLAVAILLGLILFRPSGLIDFEELEGKSVFYAWHKGVAGCGSKLKLTADHKYYVKEVCFGVEHRSGTYAIANDTIKFTPSNLNSTNRYYNFGVIKVDTAKAGKKGPAFLHLYRTDKDTLPSSIMQISQNELIN